MKRSWLLSLLLWSLTMQVSAQDANANANANANAEAVKTEASAHFSQGVELFREGAYRAALVELQRAYELAPDYRVLFNIGQTQLQLGEYVEAIKAFEGYLVQGGAAVDAQRRGDTEKDLAQLRKRVATLAITVNADGADVYVDSTLAGKSPLGATIPVSVGRHRVFAQGADGATDSVVIDVAGGDLKEITLTLVTKGNEVAAVDKPVLAPAPKPSWFTKRKRWGVGLLATVGLTATATAVMAFYTKQARDDYDALLNTPLVGKRRIDDARTEMQLKGYVTDGLGLLSVGLAVTGIVLLTIGDGKNAESPDSGGVAFSLAPNGVIAHGEF